MIENIYILPHWSWGVLFQPSGYWALIFLIILFYFLGLYNYFKQVILTANFQHSPESGFPVIFNPGQQQHH